jgi:hypothetical protein
LRLIDGTGERISPSPLPKLYEASHGICSVCGTKWMANYTGQGSATQLEHKKEESISQKATSPKKKVTTGALSDFPIA